MSRPLIFIVALALLGALYRASLPGPMFSPSAVKVPPGVVLAPDVPRQSEPEQKLARSYLDVQMLPLAQYQFTARVLSLAWYRMGREAKYSPVDLGISWGAMSDSRHIDALSWSHGARFLNYRYPDQPPIPQTELNQQIANVHVLPANPQVLRTIEALRPGQRVQARGILVELRGSDGWYWRSSLTRDDTGGGACEVMLIESISAL